MHEESTLETNQTISEKDPTVILVENRVKSYSGKINLSQNIAENSIPDTTSSNQHDTNEKKLELEDYSPFVSSIEEQEIVKGKVVSKDDRSVTVDIGFKSHGIISANEFEKNVLDNLSIGDEIEVFLEYKEDRRGDLVLSYKNAQLLRSWMKVQEAYENQTSIEGKIESHIKGGMVVSIFGLHAFLPGSQIDVRPIRDFDSYVGKTIELRVIKLNMHMNNIIVSHRVLVESALEDHKKLMFENVKVGQILEGWIKNITKFGIFVDIGGTDGLLHITDISWGRIENPKEIFHIGSKINVVVTEHNKENNRISLGLKQLQPNPWKDIELKYQPQLKVMGKVVSITGYGSFVELEKGIEGLIHVSELSWSPMVRHANQMFQKNDIVTCVVLSIDKENRKISLGVKQLEEDPWTNIFKNYQLGEIYQGTIINIASFGFFVSLDEGILGLVHSSDLSWTQNSNEIMQTFQVGNKIDVKVLSIDIEDRKISLGYKQTRPNPWEEFAANYTIGDQIEGKVFKLTAKGILLHIENDLKAFLPNKKSIYTKEDEKSMLEIDKPVTAYVRYINIEQNQIVLTQVEEEVKDKKNISFSNKSSGTSTIEDIASYRQSKEPSK